MIKYVVALMLVALVGFGEEGKCGEKKHQHFRKKMQELRAKHKKMCGDHKREMSPEAKAIVEKYRVKHEALREQMRKELQALRGDKAPDREARKARISEFRKKNKKK